MSYGLAFALGVAVGGFVCGPIGVFMLALYFASRDRHGAPPRPR